MKTIRHFLKSLIFCVAVLAAPLARAAPGDLDLSFGTGGKVITPIGSSTDVGKSVAVQSDGKIVVAGYSSGVGVAVVRYTPSGALDSSFGTGGKVITPIGSISESGPSVALQSDGKIVVVGYSFNGSNYDFAAVRHNVDGTLDSSFGTGGKVTTGFGSANDYGQSVAVQSDGKIVVAGYSGSSGNTDFALVRYNADGTLDGSFGGGTVTTGISGRDYGQSVAVQSDGKIVVAGHTYNGGYTDIAVVRYTAGGARDSGFGSGGIVTTPIGSRDDHGYSVAVQSDGKIVVAGAATNASFTEDFALVRYTPGGALDSSFGTGGKVTTPGGTSRSVALQSDGKIVVAGYSSGGIAVLRYTASGALDSSFGTGGKVTTPGGSGYSVALQRDGKIVVAGTASSDFVVVRYEGIPPEIDLQQPAGTSIASGSGKSFGSVTVGGSAELTFTIANTGSRDLNLTGSPDKVAVSGTDASLYTVTAQPNSPVTPGNTSPFTVRFAPTSGGSKSAMLMIASEDVDEGIYTIHVSGSDTTPPETMITSTQPTPTGRTNATITFTGSDDVTPGVSITYEGRLDSAAFGAVASPITLNDLADGSHTYQVRAKDASGNVDPTPASVTWVVDTTIPLPGNLDLAFGTRGKAITDIGGNTDIGQSVAVQSDGKIVVAGYSYVAGTTGDFALVRYTTSGALDSSFGTGGQVITHIGNGCLGYSAAVQSDGKIVVAGYAWIGGYPDIALARYLPSGALDTTFGTGGKVTTSLGNPFDKGQSVAVQSDGKIVVAGYARFSTDDFALVRYTASGALDIIATTHLSSIESRGYSVALQSDGKMVVAGYAAGAVSPYPYNLALVRYTTGGDLDSGFGTGGVVVTPIATIGAGYSVAVQSDGKIVVAGNSYNGGDYDFALVRYTATGALDGSFGTGGKVTTRIGSSYDLGLSYDYGRSVVVQSDGKIVVAGNSYNGSNNDFAVVRYTVSGALDSSFGTGGKVITHIGSGALGYGVALQSDGKIVVAGNSYNGSNNDFAVVRYHGASMTEMDLQHPAGTSLASGGSKSFGVVTVGSSADLTFTIANPGSADLTLTGSPNKVAVSGTDASLFTVTTQPTSPVAPSGTTAFTVRFAPTSTGSKSAALTIANNDTDEAAYTINLTGTDVSARASWRQQYFGTASNTGSAADLFDFDGDGLVNLIEWACHLDPTTGSVLPASLVRNGASLEFTYTRSVAALNAGATFTVEWSDTLAGPWGTGGVTGQILSDDGTVQVVKATLPAGSGTRRFVRLKVIAPA